MQLEGPCGPVYVNPADVLALEGLYEDLSHHDERHRKVRELHLRGALKTIQIYDTPDNVAAVFDILQERRVQT